MTTISINLQIGGPFEQIGNFTFVKAMRDRHGRKSKDDVEPEYLRRIRENEMFNSERHKDPRHVEHCRRYLSHTGSSLYDDERRG